MATARANKKVAVVAIDLPECPVCLEIMSAPIYQCQSGHSLCRVCTKNLCPPICPICRQQMTQMRNWQLEDIVSKAQVPCPNKADGCVYKMVAMDIDDHLKECIFRQMDCPLGAVFGKCSWNGKLRQMMDHFKERHPNNCNITSDTDVILNNINVNEDERFVYLLAQGKLLFILTAKIDTLQKMAYWTIQHIGGKRAAHQHIYEIHITSGNDSRKKVVFIEHCFNDAIKADEIFRLGKCAVIPLNALKHFLLDKTMYFRFFIKRVPPTQKKTATGDDNTGSKPEPRNGPRGPNGAGPKGSGPKGPGPNGPGPKGPFPKGTGPKGPGYKGPSAKKPNKV